MRAFCMVLVPLFLVTLSPVAFAGSSDDDPAVLVITKKLRGGRQITPFEQTLEDVIRASALQGDDEGNGGGSGFEEEEGETPKLDAPSAETARYEAFKDYASKSTPIETVKAALWFIASNPTNPHNTEVQATLDQKSDALSGPQQADLQAFRSAEKNAASKEGKSRAKSLEKWAKANSGNAFAETAKREATYYRDVAQSAADESGQKRSRLFVRIGVVALVLLLVGVVVLGGVAG